jgi:hypothetical protein
MSAVFDPFEIARQVDIMDLIENQYGLETHRSGRLVFTSCPKPGSSDSSPSLAIYPDQNRFHCYHCGDWYGTSIDFVMGMEQFDNVQAALRHLDKLYPELGIVNPEGRKRAESIGRYYAYTEKLAREDGARLKGKQQYMDWLMSKRGFSESAVDQFHLGVRDFNGVPRLTIPQFGTSGQIIGFVSRQMSPRDKMGRYFAKNISLNPETGMMLKKTDVVQDPIPVFRKGNYLYNISSIKDRSVCLVEGHLDVVAAWEMGVENLAAYGSNTICDGQIELLSRFESVTLIPDLNMFEKVLDNVRAIRLQFPAMPISIVDMTVIDIEDDVNDALLFLSNAGEVEMFQSMVRNAVPVETWLYGRYVSTCKTDADSYRELQKILNVSSYPVARVALVEMAGAQLRLSPELLYK